MDRAIRIGLEIAEFLEEDALICEAEEAEDELELAELYGEYYRPKPETEE